MLSGLARSLKNKREVHVGWLTPLLGSLILINLTMFWQGAWEVRDVAAPTSLSLLLILGIGGGYFLASSMIFPTPGAEVRDLDEHFMDNRRVALLAIAACNLLYLGLVGIEAAGRLRFWWWTGNALFLTLLHAGSVRHQPAHHSCRLRDVDYRARRSAARRLSDATVRFPPIAAISFSAGRSRQDAEREHVVLFA